ncbi:MAG: hypothetical protein NTW04_05410 [Elusimicrobia bacterium]|nr:hypothetical protein [Elusimicrobiota bacterium]
MAVVFLSLTSLPFISSNCSPQSFEESVNYYNQGNYDPAMEGFAQIIKNGIDNKERAQACYCLIDISLMDIEIYADYQSYSNCTKMVSRDNLRQMIPQGKGGSETSMFILNKLYENEKYRWPNTLLFLEGMFMENPQAACDLVASLNKTSNSEKIYRYVNLAKYLSEKDETFKKCLKGDFFFAKETSYDFPWNEFATMIGKFRESANQRDDDKTYYLARDLVVMLMKYRNNENKKWKQALNYTKNEIITFINRDYNRCENTLGLYFDQKLSFKTLLVQTARLEYNNLF